MLLLLLLLLLIQVVGGVVVGMPCGRGQSAVAAAALAAAIAATPTAETLLHAGLLMGLLLERVVLVRTRRRAGQRCIRPAVWGLPLLRLIVWVLVPLLPWVERLLPCHRCDRGERWHSAALPRGCAPPPRVSASQDQSRSPLKPFGRGSPTRADRAAVPLCVPVGSKQRTAGGLSNQDITGHQLAVAVGESARVGDRGSGRRLPSAVPHSCRRSCARAGAWCLPNPMVSVALMRPQRDSYGLARWLSLAVRKVIP